MSLITPPEKPQFDSDADLVARLERIIQCRTGGRIDSLKVERTDAGVVLSGVAHTYYAKQQASHAALSEMESDRLANEIEVC